ncbi:MAG: ankyrin repeat domain-containing protein [Synergistaceae bacterium]|nr:ankyrin repeat domain-containing protein [Synergistaceae bacterium]
MQSRFECLGEQFPKLSDYGRKAEKSMASDPNICLLNLGLIAEIITGILCRKNNIPDTPEKFNALIQKKIIPDNIYQKILTLIEIKNDASNDSCDSKSACSRLMFTAEELCRWFVTEKADGKFGFLADLFPPDKPVPILMNISELGREAEDNLYTNTRYCLICLGDIGEAVTDRLMSGNGIETHEKDQVDRIDVLAEKYIITDERKDLLHELRIARNKALHERYNTEYTSEAKAEKLLDDALNLCEWLFRLFMKPGYIVKARITGEIDEGYSAVIGRIPAYVPFDEVPEGKSCGAGRKYVFKVKDCESEIITLSLSMAEKDYNLSLGRLYAKYKIGQNVHVRIKSLSNSTGAVVELKDGLEARIPPSELGKRMYRNGEENEKMVRYETTARVKWFSLTQYPPMLLSVKDIEEEQNTNSEDTQNRKTPQKNPAMSDLDFRLFCKNAPYEKIIQALDEGANPNASNSNNTTALMMAAQYNRNSRVIKALIEAGAELDAQNHKGNTALMYAAMSSTPEAVRTLYDAGADIELVNSDGKKASDYAVTNRKLNGTDLVRLLRDEPEETEETLQPETESLSENETQQEEIAQPETESPAENETQQEEIAQPETESPAENETQQEETLQPEADSPTESETQQEEFSQPEADTPIESETHQEETSQPQTEPPAVNEIPQQSAESYENEDEPEYYEIQEPENTEHSEEDKAALIAHRLSLQKDFLKICRSGTEDEIAEAVSAGVSVNVTNKSSATPLMFAAQSNTAEAVEILIHAGASLNAQDDSGNTALIYAASFNHDDVVDALINAGADREIMNFSGHKASDYAKKNYRLIDTETLNKI